MRDRQSVTGEGRFEVGLNEWLHEGNVKKQGGTAHYAGDGVAPGAHIAQAYIRPWA
ncbi:MAG: hypothetical protein ACYDER_17650 [Ktedonobacteraceae bacterium]